MPEPETFPNGAEHVVTQRKRLPSGQLAVEVLLPDNRRRKVLLPVGANENELPAEIAEAMREGRRIVKGRRVGDPH